MSEDMPVWLALIIVAFLLWGSGLTLLGTIGLLRFKTFYDRLHMPALGTSWGVGGVIIAAILYASFLYQHLIVHALLLTVFLLVTTPVTLMLLSRAAMHREHSKDWQQLPPEVTLNRNDDLIAEIKNKTDDKA